MGGGSRWRWPSSGCNIAVNYFRHREEAEETAAAVEALGVKAAVIKANVGKEEEIRHLVDEGARQLGGADIFVGNAASGVLKPITEIDAKAWEWTVNINARSILFGAQAAVPYMRQRGWGRSSPSPASAAGASFPNTAWWG